MKAVEDQLPITRAPFAFALSARPAFEIADRSVAINTRDLVRVRGRPVVAVQAAAAQTDECRLAREAVARVSSRYSEFQCDTASGLPSMFGTLR